MTSQWEDPRPLPKGWTVQMVDDRPLFIDLDTQISTFTDPRPPIQLVVEGPIREGSAADLFQRALQQEYQQQQQQQQQHRSSVSAWELPQSHPLQSQPFLQSQQRQQQFGGPSVSRARSASLSASHPGGSSGRGDPGVPVPRRCPRSGGWIVTRTHSG